MMGAVVITGAGSGIGRALALAYAQPGRTLLLLGRHRPALEATADLLHGRGGQVEIRTVDVCDGRALETIAADFARDFGPVAVLIANAGISHGTLTAEPADRPVFAEIIATNLVGVERTCRAFLPYLEPAARVVGMASVAGFRGLPGAAAYSASKAGVIAYLESLRLELRGRGIRVCSIVPGYIATPMTAENPYPMPWLMPVDRAAAKMRRAIDRGRPWTVLPWQMAMLGILLRHLPIAVYDRLLSRMAGKARRRNRDPGISGGSGS